jgi:tetrathionate reductase subunit B
VSLVSMPLPVVDHDSCAVGSAGTDGCRACVERCPYDAIDVRSRPEGSRITIDPAVCQRCGACSGVCPTDAVQRPFLPDAELVDLVVAAAAGHLGVIAVTCPDSADRVASAVGTDGVIVTPSLLILDATHLLAAVVTGARAVLLVGCPRCTHDQPQLLLSVLTAFRATVDDPRRATYVEDDGSDRLEVAVRAAAELATPVAALEPGGRDALAGATTRRQRSRALLPAFGTGATRPVDVPGSGRVELDPDACVACGACAGACPTDALVLDPTVARLSVTDVDCVGCGTCASVCPDDAISVLPGVPIGAGALTPRVLLTDEPVACRTCGERYAPQRLLDHARGVLRATGLDPDDPRFQLGICPTCRDPDARQGPIHLTADEGCGCGSAPANVGCACAPGSASADDPGEGAADPSRRRFLQGVASAAAVGAALPLLRGHTPAIAIEQEPVIQPGRMGMVIDLERCIGCHACTNVCKAENNVPLGKFRDWVEEHVLGEYPDARPVFLPKLCNQCDDPGCLRACPTGAIHKRADGIVDLDPEICIACQACMHGCPYGMTFYNHQRGTADKCNLCAHRIDEGLDPACVEVCPPRCRIVGDFDDPESPVSAYLRERDAEGLREDYGLGPNVRYVGLPGELDR